MVRVNQFARRWWPLIASLTAGALIYTLAYVVVSVAEDREQLREQRDALADQSALLADIIERNETEDAGREQRLNRAVDNVELLIIDHMALHDENTALKLNDLLHQIAALLNRPAGTPPNPVNAVGPPPTERTPNHTTTTATAVPPPAPPPTTAPPATTTPDQRNCAKRPTGPRC